VWWRLRRQQNRNLSSEPRRSCDAVTAEGMNQPSVAEHNGKD